MSQKLFSNYKWYAALQVTQQLFDDVIYLLTLKCMTCSFIDNQSNNRISIRSRLLILRRHGTGNRGFYYSFLQTLNLYFLCFDSITFITYISKIYAYFLGFRQPFVFKFLHCTMRRRMVMRIKIHEKLFLRHECVVIF